MVDRNALPLAMLFEANPGVQGTSEADKSGYEQLIGFAMAK